MKTTALVAFQISLAALFASCQSPQGGSMTASGERIWHVKAIHPEGRFVDVKAIDANGAILDVKALQTPGNLHVLDVKALRDGDRLAVKVLPGGDVKAIDADGTILDIWALPPDGSRLPIKGLRRANNILHIKAMAPDGAIWGVKSISPDGHLLDVKGVKMMEEPSEGSVHGVEIAAHVKALPQVTELAEMEKIWHVKAIHPEGRTIDVKALDESGNIIDIKSIERPGNQHVMDVKALQGEARLAVKVVPGGAVKAISADGVVYDVWALLPGGERLPVKAVVRTGNVLHIKAVAPGGVVWAVKALSPEGFHHDVKGVKMMPDDVEAEVGGVQVHAHVKALPQVLGSEN